MIETDTGATGNGRNFDGLDDQDAGGRGPGRGMTGPLTRRAVMAGLSTTLPATVLAQPKVGAPPTRLTAPYPVVGKVERHDPALDALIDSDARVEKIMDGFVWAEGPVWIGGPRGYLLMSDPRANRIMRWSSREGPSEWLRHSGYAAESGWSYRLWEPGTNGLIAARGGLVAADSGNRIIARLDLKTRTKQVLASHFDGKRLNSPNDLALHPDGSIFFTDPPFGMTGGLNSRERELGFTGLFRLAMDGSVTLIDDSMSPNGVGVSPDGRRLYCTDRSKWIWVMWDLDAQGRATNKRQFIDPAKGAGGDGFKLDADGNMWSSSRDGVSIFNPQGARLGVIRLDDVVANCEIGADGYLYIASNTRMARVPMRAKKLSFRTA